MIQQTLIKLMAKSIRLSTRDHSEQPLRNRAQCNIPGIPLIASAEQDSADISARQPADFWADVIIIAGSEGRCCTARQELLHSASSSVTLMTDAAFSGARRPAGCLSHLFSVKRLASVLHSMN